MVLSPSQGRHIRCVLTAAQHRAQGDHQQVMELMQSGIAGPRIIKTFPACTKFLQGILPGRASYDTPWSRTNRSRATEKFTVKLIRNATPLPAMGFLAAEAKGMVI